MRIGIMGVHYGHIHGMFRSAQAYADAEFVGIVEPDDELCAGIVREQSMPRYHSLEEMLAQARPELVLEGIEHPEKTVLVETCAAAGVHVLLDKPLCYDESDWQRMYRAVQTHGIKLSMWFTSRSYPPFVALRRAILDGELGEIVSLISTHPHKTSRKESPAFYFDDKRYAGTFHDVACHGVDQVRWLTGAEYTGVHALQTCKKYTDAPQLIDHAQASFQLSDHSLATLTADWLTPDTSPSFGDTRFIIMGTEGSAHLRAYADDHLLIVTNHKGPYEPPLPASEEDTFIKDLCQAISRNEEHFISTRDVLAVSRACLVAQKSAQDQGQFLPIEDFSL